MQTGAGCSSLFILDIAVLSPGVKPLAFNQPPCIIQRRTYVWPSIAKIPVKSNSQEGLSVGCVGV
jgi:hypothetical protein